MGLAARKPRLERQDFIAWENGQSERHEYLEGEVFAMVGVRDRHNIIAGNFYLQLRPHLKGSPCRTYMADIKLEVAAADAVFYPDLFVTCEPQPDPLVKRDAGLIIEVLSPSTEAYDRGRKFAAYRLLPGLREYLLVSSDAALIEVYTRTGDAWLLREYRTGDSLTLGSLELDLKVDDIYEDVDLSPEPAGQEST